MRGRRSEIFPSLLIWFKFPTSLPTNFHFTERSGKIEFLLSERCDWLRQVSSVFSSESTRFRFLWSHKNVNFSPAPVSLHPMKFNSSPRNGLRAIHTESFKTIGKYDIGTETGEVSKCKWRSTLMCAIWPEYIDTSALISLQITSNLIGNKPCYEILKCRKMLESTYYC